MAKSASTIKKERFQSVASRRVQKVLDDIDSLSKCANRSTYEYSDDEIKKMMRVINERVTLLKSSFEANSKSGKKTFEF